MHTYVLNIHVQTYLGSGDFQHQTVGPGGNLAVQEIVPVLHNFTQIKPVSKPYQNRIKTVSKPYQARIKPVSDCIRDCIRIAYVQKQAAHC